MVQSFAVAVAALVGMTGCASGAPAQEARQRVAPPRGFGISGVHIPLPAAADVTLAFVSDSPVQLLAAENVTTGEDVAHPLLAATAHTILAGGLEIGETCPEKLRIGDTIERGLVQNTGDAALALTLSSGVIRLMPGQGIYVGELTPINRPGEAPGLLATHTIECHCTCAGDNSSGSISLACGAPCNPDGNQCGMNGTECSWDPDGEGPTPPRQGVATLCVEVIVPNR